MKNAAIAVIVSVGVLGLGVVLFAAGAPAAAGPASGAPSAAGGAVRVGYADPMKALADTADGKKARATLEKELESKKKLLDTKEQEVAKAADALKKKRSIMKPEAIAAEEEAVQKLYTDYQTLNASVRTDLDKRERELSRPLLARLECILKKVGEEEGYTVILPAAGVLWAPDRLDLTSELTRRYEAGACKDAKPRESGTAAPADKPKAP